jgi:hypothetical protein
MRLQLYAVSWVPPDLSVSTNTSQILETPDLTYDILTRSCFSMVLAVQKENGPTERRRKRSIGQTVALRSELSGVVFFRSTSLQFDDSGESIPNLSC